jgi:cell division protein FtsN
VAHRDYKQTGTPRGSRKASGGKKGGVFKVVLMALVSSLFIAAILLWFLWPRAQDFKKTVSVPSLQAPPKTTTVEPAKPQATPQTPAADKSTAAPGQDYTFYDILPGNRPPKPLPPEKKPVQWWLQVAALKNPGDADSLRARLSLLNFNTVVQPTPAGEPLLYRVRVGPYPDQAAAEAAQANLAENKIDSKALKEAVTP